MITVIELGCANTASVLFALERLGVDAHLSSDAAEIAAAQKVVLPGVGAAGFAMNRIHELGLFDVIRGLDVPLLGVCLGQQLLFEGSDEGDVQCLGLIPGRVTRMEASKDFVVPHMGWNQLEVSRDDALTAGVNDGDYAYFVHSFVCPVNDCTLATATYGEPFAAMVRKGQVWGCQFHPERSSSTGARILENFVKL
ncbi:imidazole glycerol phosphate synthase, glutamine amidotransferase subunit [Asticcacaulis biprosthecium C19]|uniref:Imidazole glycerol phosphate synthase subunit HisH n=1 Tax=Asticcacaulis biprosthecium C19 TaxID=715226 RepID=F4QL61_9CAUL|nr:imidazole glycerol phosphate synthase subunit HisH [Asticcacaulis biprosthecium]EGF93436.1 imidazole glycerol phosphate synthase, glutamine amidotransferase subunit [Asticcacaulis biprosthecium C19]